MTSYKLAASAAILLVSSGAWADRDDDARRSPLKGIRGYEIDVGESINDERISTKADLRTVTELALRREGIKILDTPTGRRAKLHVYVTALRDNSGLVAYTVTVSVSSSVRLLHNGIVSTAIVWLSGGGVATVGASHYSTSLRDTVSELLDGFANDHLAANPIP